MRNSQKNKSIEFFRFFFCCILFLLHFRGHGNFDGWYGQFNGGYLGVEFFFITAGFFLMQRADREQDSEEPAGKAALRYLWSRYKRLYPMYLLSLLILIPIRLAMEPDFSLAAALTAGLPDLLALQIFWRPFELNMFLWYISALIWASFAVYYLVRKNKRVFLWIIEPAALIGFVAYTWIRFGFLDLAIPSFMWLSGIRAFAEIGLGCEVYIVYRCLSERKTQWNTALCTMGEALILLAVVWIMYATRHSPADYLAILLLAVFTLLLFLKQGLLSRTLDCPLSDFLGSLSYVMYLNQFALTELTDSLLPGLGHWYSAAWRILLLALISWVEIKAVDLVKTRFRA